MYVDNMHDLENSITEIRNMSTKFNNFVQRFEKNYNRKEQWITFYRLHILYRNHETNNYAEASIRVIKDILLSRTKAYNAVALVDFIVNVGENYFTLRLLDHAHERHSESHRLYSKLCFIPRFTYTVQIFFNASSFISCGTFFIFADYFQIQHNL
uniref:Uncharacterized protein n=1 Tax=Schizaphis graminum TaxID=13262 RepID=A0A2S2PH68_SCHGA